MKTLSLTLLITMLALNFLKAGNTELKANEKPAQKISSITKKALQERHNPEDKSSDIDYSPQDTQQVGLEKEPFVNDIPFSTREVVLDYYISLLEETISISKLISCDMDNPVIKDDLPFVISRLRLLYEELKAGTDDDVRLEKEPYINDVPFDTKEVIN